MLVAEQLTKSWTSFARTGDPNYGGKNIWPRYTMADDVMREFSGDPEGTIANVNKARVDYQLDFVRAFYGLK